MKFSSDCLRDGCVERFSAVESNRTFDFQPISVKKLPDNVCIFRSCFNLTEKTPLSVVLLNHSGILDTTEKSMLGPKLQRAVSTYVPISGDGMSRW